MAENSPQPSTIANGGFRLTIEFDNENRVLSATVNDIPVFANNPESGGSRADAPTPVKETCCAGEGVDSRIISQRFLHLMFGETVVATLVVAILQYLAYRILFNEHEFVNRYGWWVLYLDVSAAALITTISYLRSFVYAHMSHMMGMMIGMTIGMQVGTMVGAVVGATNGFFIGSVAGMSLGVLSGVITAWCCGPMAVIHGLMAGVMGGTMGAMVVVMMIPDHVLTFMPLFTALNIAILIWFTYLFFRECCSTPNLQTRGTLNLYALSSISVLTVGLLSALMVYGPKGPMVWTGQPMNMGSADEACADDSASPFAAREGGKPCAKIKQPAQMMCGAMMTR